MSDPVLPALPGTYVLIGVGIHEWCPVIGWEKRLTVWEPICFPVLPRDLGPTLYFIPDPTDPDNPSLYDPRANRLFRDTESWSDFYDGSEPVPVESGLEFDIGSPVTFGDKAYKNKSFWHFGTVKAEFLFELDGGETCPDDPRVSKINREAFFNARKTMPVVVRDEVIRMARQDIAPEIDSEVEDLI